MKNKKKFNFDDGFIVFVLFKIFHDFFPLFDPFRWVKKIGWFLASKYRKSKHYENKVRLIVGDDEDAIKDYMEHDLYFVDTYSFPEIWALLHLVLSYVFFKCVNCFPKIIALIIGLYSALRVFELFVYQVNVLFFDQLDSEFNKNRKPSAMKRPTRREGQTKYYIKSAQRTVILLIFNIIEYIFQFALMFKAFNIFYDLPVANLTIIASFEIFMNAYDGYNEVVVPLLNIIYLEIIVGVFMNVVCLAYFIGILPAVKTQKEIFDSDENKN